MSRPDDRRDDSLPENPEMGDSRPEDQNPEGRSDAPPIDAGKGEGSYVGRVARGAGISTAGQGIGRLVGFLTQSIVARTLGPAWFGIYTLGMAVANFVNIISQFGFDNGVVRYVARFRAQGDNERVRGAIIASVLIAFCISLVVSTIVFFGAEFIATTLLNREPRAALMIRGFSFALPFFVLMSMLVWATQGFQTVTYATYVQQLIRPIAYFVLVVGVFVVVNVFLGGVTEDGPPWTSIIGILSAFAVSMMIGVVAGIYFLKRLYPLLFDGGVKPKFEIKALVSVSIPMSVQRVTQYTNNWTGPLILTQFASAGAVGIFQAAFRTATLATLVRYAFNGIFSPIISNLHSQGSMEDLKHLYKDVTRWTFTGAFALFAVVVLLAEEALRLFGGQEYTAGWTALIICSGAQLFSTVVGPSPRMLAMTGNQNVVMIASITGAATGIVGTLALSPVFGIVGAAIGVSSAITTENAISLTMVRRRFGFWPFTVQYLKPLGAGVLAAAVAYGAKLVFSGIPMVPGGFIGTALTVVVTGTVFMIGYVALLLLFGLTDTDKEFLGTFWQVARQYLRRGNRDQEAG